MNENNYEAEKNKNKIIIKGVKIDNIEDYLNKKNIIGSEVKGLIKIILERNGDVISPEEYVIVYKGIIKKVVTPSEAREYNRKKAIREIQNKISRKVMWKKRSGKYLEEVEKYFPGEELEAFLEEIAVNKGYLTRGKLREEIFKILDERGVSPEEQKEISYKSKLWQDTLKNLMKKKGYVFVKSGDKYVKPQE